MLKKAIKQTVFLGLLCALIVIAYPVFAEQIINENSSETSLDLEERDRILDATVYLKVFHIKEDSAGLNANVNEVISAIASDGLGTIVQSQAGQVIVTHNHWELYHDGELADFVRFYSVSNELQHEMSGKDFIRNVIYQDNGTMILPVPDHMKIEFPALTNGGEEINLGETVYLLNQELNSGGGVTLFPAQLTASITKNGLPVYELHSLNGDSIYPGDSGGGIWFEGELIGNMWQTSQVVLVDQDSGEVVGMKSSDKSFGAVLSPIVQSMIAIN